nr:hypothetical protein [Tanacetum cinerariifolium]
MGKTIGELHALLIEYEKGLPKKVATPQVMAIQGGRIQKANKKSLNAKGKGKGKEKDKNHIPKPKNPKPSAKEHPAQDDTSHHCKEVGHCKRNYPTYLDELIKKKKQVNTTSSSDIFVFKNEVENQLGKTIKVLRSDRGDEYISQEFKDYLKALKLSSSLHLHTHQNIMECQSAARILNMVPTKKVDKTPYELWYIKVFNMSNLKVWGCDALMKRDTPDKHQQRYVKCIFIEYPKEIMGYYFNFSPENKIVVARYAELLKKNIISQEVSGRGVELEEIQEEDTSHSENTSEIPMEVEGFEPPQEELILVHRYPKAELRVDFYCNAGFETDRDDIKSLTGYLRFERRRSRLEKLQVKYYCNVRYRS